MSLLLQSFEEIENFGRTASIQDIHDQLRYHASLASTAPLEFKEEAIDVTGAQHRHLQVIGDVQWIHVVVLCEENVDWRVGIGYFGGFVAVCSIGIGSVLAVHLGIVCHCIIHSCFIQGFVFDH
jgi:hypothetical protein